MAETVFNRAKIDWLNADTDWIADSIRALMVSGVVTIDPDDVFVSDFIAAGAQVELTDGTYARQILGTKTVTQNDAANRGEADSANIDYGALDNETPTALLIFRFVSVDGDSPCISVHDTNFGSPSNGAGYVVETTGNVIHIT